MTRAGLRSFLLRRSAARKDRAERKEMQRLAEQLGFTLGRKRIDGRWAVNGHHGTWSSILRSEGCGTYDLVLNVEEKRVDCANCGATDLVKKAVR